MPIFTILEDRFETPPTQQNVDNYSHFNRIRFVGIKYNPTFALLQYRNNHF